VRAMLLVVVVVVVVHVDVVVVVVVMKCVFKEQIDQIKAANSLIHFVRALGI